MVQQRILGNAVQLSHWFVERVLRPGDVAVDATAGNGHDTLFLAQLVGSAGKVYAFDVQQAALARTGERLAAANSLTQVQLINDGHQKMNEYIQDQVTTVMFNLGYLPGGGSSFNYSAGNNLPSA